MAQQLRHRQGRGRDHQRPRGHVTATPTQWGNGFFQNLFGYEWELSKSGRRAPMGREGRTARGRAPSRAAPDSPRRAPTNAHHRPLAALRPGLREDLAPFMEHPEELADAFARAWSSSRTATWARSRATSVPRSRRRSSSGRTRSPRSPHELIGRRRSPRLKAQILASGLTVSQLVSVAWASASSFRGSDKRGGANAARIRLRTAALLGGQRPGAARDGPRRPRGGSSSPSTRPRTGAARGSRLPT